MTKPAVHFLFFANARAPSTCAYFSSDYIRVPNAKPGRPFWGRELAAGFIKQVSIIRISIRSTFWYARTEPSV